MEFRIADTFTDSLARLTGDEQKAVKTTAFDLQINAAKPGMRFHKLERARDKSFWSVRVNSDVRLIVHRTDASLLLCYVGHHDKAYEWAERRIRETVKEVVVPVYRQVEQVAEAAAAAPVADTRPVLAAHSDDELLGYGVPAEWISDVKAASGQALLALSEHLPAEAAEAVLELATGGKPRVAPPVAAETSPFDHPDAQRRFRVMTNVDELERALEYPWEKWTVFLHPEQRQWVEREYAGPARVSGSAGTGKTIVALHRAAHLARAHQDARVLLTTFSDALANALHTKLKRLLGAEPRLGERIDVHSLDSVGLRLHKAHVGLVTIASGATARDLVRSAAGAVEGHKFSLRFLLTEWEQVVDAWQIETWDAYRDVARLGRRTRLPEAQRKVLWSIFERVREGLKAANLVTSAGMFSSLAAAISKSRNLPYDFVVVDEAQDVSVAQLRFLAALGGTRPNALFFAGDLGQRIFQQPFSWKALGVDIRGRSRTLRVNYRTSHQIRSQADRLLGPVVTDVDGNAEDRSHTMSVFNGPPPTIREFAGPDDESKAVGAWLAEQAKGGVLPHEFGVFVRSPAQINRVVAAVGAASLSYKILDEHVETASGHVSIATMHIAKGLEFRSVVVMACDDEVIPLQERIEAVGDSGDLQEVYDTERQLLYVACTRARDHLLVTGVEPERHGIVNNVFDDIGYAVFGMEPRHQRPSATCERLNLADDPRHCVLWLENKWSKRRCTEPSLGVSALQVT